MRMPTTVIVCIALLVMPTVARCADKTPSENTTITNSDIVQQTKGTDEKKKEPESKFKQFVEGVIAPMLGVGATLLTLLAGAYKLIQTQLPGISGHKQVRENLDLLAILDKDRFPNETRALENRIKAQITALTSDTGKEEHRDVPGGVSVSLFGLGCLAVGCMLLYEYHPSPWAYVFSLILFGVSAASFAVGAANISGSDRYSPNRQKGSTEDPASTE